MPLIIGIESIGPVEHQLESAPGALDMAISGVCKRFGLLNGYSYENAI